MRSHFNLCYCRSLQQRFPQNIRIGDLAMKMSRMPLNHLSYQQRKDLQKTNVNGKYYSLLYVIKAKMSFVLNNKNQILKKKY